VTEAAKELGIIRATIHRKRKDCFTEMVGRIGIPKGTAMDCAMVAAAPVLPGRYVVNASRIAGRRMILVGYRLADDTVKFKI
jgi:hypothetical protein